MENIRGSPYQVITLIISILDQLKHNSILSDK